MKTPEEIMQEFAEEHSYSSWGELMYDTHENVQIKYTKEVMKLYHEQMESEHQFGVAGEISDILDENNVSCPLENKKVTKIINDRFCIRTTKI